MIVEETKIIKREVYVAPCIKCGSSDIRIYDCGYPSFNCGGGECRKCGNKVTATSLECDPSIDVLAAIWNGENDIASLIAEAEKNIKDNQQLIKTLKRKR